VKDSVMRESLAKATAAALEFNKISIREGFGLETFKATHDGKYKVNIVFREKNTTHVRNASITVKLDKPHSPYD
jgi:hypothetical protein